MSEQPDKTLPAAPDLPDRLGMSESAAAAVSPTGPDRRSSVEAVVDTYGQRIVAALPPIDERDIRTLQFLARLDTVTVQQARVAVTPWLTDDAMRDTLNRLVADNLAWTASSRVLAVNQVGQFKQVRRQSAHVFGLTTDGRELLRTLEVETDPTTTARFTARDTRARKPDARTMAHDLQVAWWTINAMRSAAENRLVHTMYVQTEFIPHKTQRIDALLIFRLRLSAPRAPLPLGIFPYFNGVPRRDDEIDIRLALEVDRGTEELSVLLGKCETYRDLHRTNVYNDSIGGPVLPVFIAQTPARGRQIAERFRAIWPSGWGVISTPQSANDPDGVLWGDYRMMGNGAPFPLLSRLIVGTDGHVTSSPLLTRDDWTRYTAVAPRAEEPEQIAGRAGGIEYGRLHRERVAMQARRTERRERRAGAISRAEEGANAGE